MSLEVYTNRIADEIAATLGVESVTCHTFHDERGSHWKVETSTPVLVFSTVLGVDVHPQQKHVQEYLVYVLQPFMKSCKPQSMAGVLRQASHGRIHWERFEIAQRRVLVHCSIDLGQGAMLSTFYGTVEVPLAKLQATRFSLVRYLETVAAAMNVHVQRIERMCMGTAPISDMKRIEFDDLVSFGEDMQILLSYLHICADTAMQLEKVNAYLPQQEGIELSVVFDPKRPFRNFHTVLAWTAQGFKPFLLEPFEKEIYPSGMYAPNRLQKRYVIDFSRYPIERSQEGLSYLKEALFASVMDMVKTIRAYSFSLEDVSDCERVDSEVIASLLPHLRVE